MKEPSQYRVARFLGFTQKSYTPDGEKIWCDHKHGLPVGELKFNESWDWLMPVIEKINSLEIEGYGKPQFVISEHYVFITHTIDRSRYYISDISDYENVLKAAYATAWTFILCNDNKKFMQEFDNPKIDASLDE